MATSFSSHQKKKAISLIVEKNPGIGYAGIQNDSGFVNGILSHHLETMVRDGIIRIRKGKRRVWFFSNNSNSDDDLIFINIRKETCRNILIFLLQKQSGTFKEITNAVKKSPSTTSTTLKQLAKDNVVKIIPGFTKKYELHDYDRTLEIVKMFELTSSDKLKDRFADTFSYY